MQLTHAALQAVQHFLVPVKYIFREQGITFALIISAMRACTVSVLVTVTHTEYDYAIHAYIRTINAIEGTIHEHDPSEVWHLHVQKEMHYV